MEEDDDFTGAIEKLMFQGIINSGDVKKLQNAGIYSCNGLMMHTKKNLTGIYGLSNTKVDQIWEAVEKIVARASPLFPLNIKAYELKSKIGFGPRATVYKAYCIPTKSMVAIKIFINRGADSDVRREATTLSDPNLLTYSSFKVDWVVMPFMACGSLQSIVYSSFPLGLPERYACFFLSKILKGMVHLHDQEIDHGGIKGGNMLVDSDGEVKICVSTPSTQACDDIRDFGLLAAELVYGVGGGKSYLHAEKKVSEELQDLMSLCRRSTRRVSADDLLRHACFKELVENETVSNFLADLPSLEVMANQAQKALNNHLKTVNTIGRKDLMDKLLGKRKRMEVLRSSIALDSRQKGQIDHWKMELESCERKVKNLEKQILERRPIEQ